MLEQEGIEFEVCQPGGEGASVHGVLSLPGQRHAALRAGRRRCKMKSSPSAFEADGIVLASPVYHGGIAGAV